MACVFKNVWKKILFSYKVDLVYNFPETTYFFYEKMSEGSLGLF